MRILVTGSREWTDDSIIYRALAAHPPIALSLDLSNVVVHGKAPGADMIADHWAHQFGWLTEPHPAKDFPSPRSRNQYMVNLGADVCLTFAARWNSGTGMCARMARRAGIPVVDYGADTAPRGVAS